MGPTTQCLLLEQFSRTREGDRFWYEGGQTFTAGQLAEIRLSSLARVICDNADNIKRIPANVFLNTDQSQFLDCSQVNKPSLNPWTGEIPVRVRAACCKNNISLSRLSPGDGGSRLQTEARRLPVRERGSQGSQRDSPAAPGKD